MSLTQNFTTMKPKGLHLLGAISVLALMLPAISAPALAQSELAEANSGSEFIEGTWILSIDRIHQPGNSFTSLMSFTGGGVALATGSRDRLPPPPISPLYGSWKRTAPNRAVVTLNFFIFDPLGNPVGMLMNHISFHLKGANHLEGSGVAFQCNVEGENCVSAPGFEINITGKRIIPEGVEE